MEHANANLSDGGTPVADESLEQLIVRAKAEGNPWANMAGIFRDDSLFDEWVEIMRENRRKDDEELGI